MKVGAAERQNGLWVLNTDTVSIAPILEPVEKTRAMGASTRPFTFKTINYEGKTEANLVSVTPMAAVSIHSTDRLCRRQPLIRPRVGPFLSVAARTDPKTELEDYAKIRSTDINAFSKLSFDNLSGAGSSDVCLVRAKSAKFLSRKPPRNLSSVAVANPFSVLGDLSDDM